MLIFKTFFHTFSKKKIIVILICTYCIYTYIYCTMLLACALTTYLHDPKVRVKLLPLVAEGGIAVVFDVYMDKLGCL